MSDKVEVGAYEAKTHLPDLLRRVRAGERFTITQRGEPVADLVPVGTDRDRAGADAARRMRALMLAAREALPAGSEAVDVKALIAEGRD